MGVGSPDPPQFVYDDEEYKNVFLSGNSLITWSLHQLKLYTCSVKKLDKSFIG